MGDSLRCCLKCVNSHVETDIAALHRVPPQVIVVDGRLRGAMLVGDTSLAETFENLILSATDVSTLGDELLSRDVDIEDFFD